LKFKKSMKITIQVGGRFHAFNLAYQLERRGYLQKLITSYPKLNLKLLNMEYRARK